MKATIIPRVLFCVIVVAFIVAPVSAVSGLSIASGNLVTTTNGSTSRIITITDSDIASGSNIVIDLYYAKGLIASSTYTDANILISTNSANATWTGTVANDYLTMTSSGTTVIGEKINVTFKGTSDNPWIAYSGGLLTYPLTATRDGYDPEPFDLSVDTPVPVSTGMTITDGSPITASGGATSYVITVKDAPIAPDGTITLLVPFMPNIIASGNFNDANVIIKDSAASATWTRTVTGDRVILTSTGGPTAIDETVNVTFTGASNPWSVSLASGFTYQTAVRNDGHGAGYFNFEISTPPPVPLIVTDGATIGSSGGTSSPVITITGSDIYQDSTITIDVSNLNQYVGNGDFSNANIIINDSATHATWTGFVTSGSGVSIITLTSTGGPTVADENITVTFTGAVNPWIGDTHGEKTETLFVTRMDGAGTGTFNFAINTTPPAGAMVVANFSASPTSDLVPLTVNFVDSSLGNPNSWSWDFGDGAVSSAHNPVHTYTNVGLYTVSLTATNAYGSDTKTRWDYINAVNGTVRQANTAIAGLTIPSCSGSQTVTVDTSVLPAVLNPDNSVIVITPPSDRGFNTVTLFSTIGGFSRNGNLISGTLTGARFVSEEIPPPFTFSDVTGSKASFNYSMDVLSYPCNAVLTTTIREGMIPAYDLKFRQIVSATGGLPSGTAYTATIEKTNFPDATPATFHFSVNSSWKPRFPGDLYIWHISNDGSRGEMLPTTYLYTVPADKLEIYKASSSTGASVIGLCTISGSNNPFQFVSFAIAAVIAPAAPAVAAPASAGGSGTGKAAVTPGITSAPTAVPPDPGQTVHLSTNGDGVTNQIATLQSTDKQATVTIPVGIIAKNSTGYSLASITIKATPEENLPTPLPGTDLKFAGMAYDLSPEGATFSPALSLTFAFPSDVPMGQEYTIKGFDHATGTWQDLPLQRDPATGAMTVSVSHFCCFALFGISTAENMQAAVATTLPQETVKPASAPAPTVMSNLLSIVLWVVNVAVKNVLIVTGIAVLAVAVFLYDRKRRRERWLGRI